MTSQYLERLKELMTCYPEYTHRQYADALGISRIMVGYLIRKHHLSYTVKNDRKGSANPFALGDATKNAIRQAIASGEKQSEIAKRFGVSRSLVCKMKSGER